MCHNDYIGFNMNMNNNHNNFPPTKHVDGESDAGINRRRCIVFSILLFLSANKLSYKITPANWNWMKLNEIEWEWMNWNEMDKLIVNTKSHIAHTRLYRRSHIYISPLNEQEHSSQQQHTKCSRKKQKQRQQNKQTKKRKINNNHKEIRIDANLFHDLDK